MNKLIIELPLSVFSQATMAAVDVCNNSFVTERHYSTGRVVHH